MELKVANSLIFSFVQVFLINVLMSFKEDDVCIVHKGEYRPSDQLNIRLSVDAEKHWPPLHPNPCLAKDIGMLLAPESP